MKLMHRLERFFAPNLLHLQLYPPPSIRFRTRSYEPGDRPAVIELYRKNEPDRLPANGIGDFERTIDQPDASFFVCESPDFGIIACGGVTAYSPEWHVLYYGLVDPEHQGKRVGATLALARIVFASRGGKTCVSTIYAIPASIGYYQRFGYVNNQTWPDGNGENHPIGHNVYQRKILRPIASVLRRRGHLIDPALPLAEDPVQQALPIIEIEGVLRFEIKPREPAPSAVEP